VTKKQEEKYQTTINTMVGFKEKQGENTSVA